VEEYQSLSCEKDEKIDKISQELESSCSTLSTLQKEFGMYD